MKVKMEFKNTVLDDHFNPTTLTILPTYRCTAKCRECCFCSSPDLAEVIPTKTIIKTIYSAKDAFDTLQLVVFSGGECFLLNDDLFQCIAVATKCGLSTRCVTNAYWGKSYKKAKKISKNLHDSGCGEVNISTGVEHSEWVSTDAVVNAAKALLSEGMAVVVTVEKDVEGSTFLARFVERQDVRELMRCDKFLIKSNTWMYFKKNHLERGSVDDSLSLESGCDQLFNSIVVTPHQMVSSCCGITFEHQPEMIIGDLRVKDIASIYKAQIGDMLKMAISSVGPYKLLEQLYGKDSQCMESLRNANHICEACLLLSKKESEEKVFLSRIKDREYCEKIISQYILKSSLYLKGISA